MFLDLGDICESRVGWYNLAKQTRELDLLNSLFSSHISHTKYINITQLILFVTFLESGSYQLQQLNQTHHTFCDLFRIRWLSIATTLPNTPKNY